MRLHFTGLRIDDDVVQALTGLGFSVTTDRSTSEDIPSLVVVRAEPAKLFSALKKWRTRCEKAWLVAVISKKQLSDSEFCRELLESPLKNDVWIFEDWPSLFWFQFQRFLNALDLQTQKETLDKELSSLRTTYEHLSQSSQNLVTQLEKDVALAANIQRSVLPKHTPEIPGVRVAVKYVAASGLGGDYYDLFEFGDKRRYGVLMADSKTHGMAAALLSVLLKTRLDEMRDRFPDSKSFVGYLNTELQSIHGKELGSLSLFFGIFDRSSLHFDFTTAGHLRPILCRSGNLFPIPISTNPPLGGLSQFDFRSNEVLLKPGDLLVLHTDGLDDPLKKMGLNTYDAVAKILKRHTSPEPLDIQNELMAFVDQYTENQTLDDDVTMIHFSVSEKALYLAGSGGK